MKKTAKKVERSTEPSWASTKGIERDHGVDSRLGVEIVFRMELANPGDWIEVDEMLEKGQSLGFCEVTKVVKL